MGGDNSTAASVEVHHARRTRVFLSYAHQDRERALGVKLLIELGDAQVFMDWHSIRPGDRWQDAVEKALADCDVLCVYWTKAASKSKWVQREYEAFMRRYPDRRCIPICADASQLPRLLAERQAIPDFLAPANRVLSLGHELSSKRIPRSERERLVLKELKSLGIELSPEQQRLVLLFALGTATGMSIVAMISSVSWHAKLTLTILVLGTTVSVALLMTRRVDTNAHRPTPAQPQKLSEPQASSTQTDPPQVPPPQTIAPHPAPTQPEIVTPGPSETAVCHQQPGSGASTRVIVEPRVSATDRATCQYLEQALRASERDFMDAIVGPGRDDSRAELVFPLCTDKAQTATWQTRLQHPSLRECNIHRSLSLDDKTTGAPRAMFQTCARSLAPNAAALSAFDELKADVAGCLRSEDGWQINENSRPNIDSRGLLVLHGGENGIARVYFSRLSGGRNWSTSITLGGNESISHAEATTGKRAPMAQLELHVALSTELPRVGW